MSGTQAATLGWVQHYVGNKLVGTLVYYYLLRKTENGIPGVLFAPVDGARHTLVIQR